MKLFTKRFFDSGQEQGAEFGIILSPILKVIYIANLNHVYDTHFDLDDVLLMKN